MPRALIVFGTTDGQTARIASALATHFRSAGLTVTVVDAAGAAPDPAGSMRSSSRLRCTRAAINAW